MWSLNVTTTNSSTPLKIVFQANGELDSSTDPTDLQQASSIIPSGIDRNTFWQTVNMVFVMLYWTTLADLGHLSPVGQQIYNTNNNPFVNQTLLKTYIDFFNATSAATLDPLPEVSTMFPYDSTLDVVQAYFVETYSCTALVKKTPIAIFVALVTGLYALIISAKSAVTTAITWYYRRGYGDQGTIPSVVSS